MGLRIAAWDVFNNDVGENEEHASVMNQAGFSMAGNDHRC